MALSLIASGNIKCSMKFPKNELIVLCCNNTLVDSLQNVGPNEKLDHSIVSPLQARESKQEKGKDEHILKIWDQMKTTWFYSRSLNTQTNKHT
jgi:hypothetical protein